MQVERLLDSVDAVIYLLDYTKLKTSDEAEVLQRLKEINPQLIARLSQRLFFVVNKADMIETSEGMDADDTKQYVADLVTGQMQDERFQLKPDQVCGLKLCPDQVCFTERCALILGCSYLIAAMTGKH